MNDNFAKFTLYIDTNFSHDSKLGCCACISVWPNRRLHIDSHKTMKCGGPFDAEKQGLILSVLGVSLDYKQDMESIHVCNDNQSLVSLINDVATGLREDIHIQRMCETAGIKVSMMSAEYMPRESAEMKLTDFVSRVTNIMTRS